MQLTDEQRKAIEWAIGMASQHNIHNSPLRALLAAHNAGAQEKPVAWRVSGTYTNGLHFSHIYNDKATAEKSAASAAMRVLTPLYDHPQPMPQTDAARDVIEAARIVLGAGLAKDISGNGVKVFVTSVSAAERLSAAIAEIERLDRAKGE